MPKIVEKKCKDCGVVKPISEFSINRAYKDGYEARCRDCKKKFRYRYTLKCQQCGKKFKSNTLDRKYCSISCSNTARNEPKVKCRCDICSKEIIVIASQFKKNKHNYCSIECARKGETEFYSGKHSKLYSKVKVKCNYCGKAFSINQYRAEHERYHYCSKQCKANHQKIILTGENNPSYNPNLTDEERIYGRYIPNYKEWRRAVYERDNYKCQCCGKSISGHLVAHHLYNYAEHKDMRTDINNGITLCEYCHKEFHDHYGYRENTKEQFKKFIELKHSNNIEQNV
jgi:hypothetical protein